MGEVIDMKTRQVISRGEVRDISLIRAEKALQKAEVVVVPDPVVEGVADILGLTVENYMEEQSRELIRALREHSYILIPGFPLYEINQKGSVRRSDNHKRVPWQIGHGWAQVNLFDNQGRKTTRGIKKLVRALFDEEIDTRV